MRIRIFFKFIFLLLISQNLCVITFAQTYTLNPNDSIVISGMLEDQQTLTIEQQNISGDTLQLAWVKISESVPALWESYVCDNSFCYTSLADSGMMQPFAPSGNGFLLVHFTPHVNYGTAVVRYAVWDVNTPNLKDTLTFILDVSNPSGIPDSEIESLFSIYPNPASGSININSKSKKEFSVELINENGEMVYSIHNVSGHVTLDVKSAQGIYFVQLATSSKRFCKPVLIQQVK
jgi:hypothetical protein